MANRGSVGFGFIPVRHADGRGYVGGGRPYYIPSSDSNNYFIGDVVKITGATNTAAVLTSGGVGSSANWDVGTLKVVGAATAGSGNALTGVIVGIGTDATDVHRAPYRKASVGTIVYVEDDPRVVFKARLLGATLLTGTGLSDTASVSLGSGSTATGRSGHGIDSTTLQTSTGSTYQIRLLELSTDPGENDLSSANPVVHCMINNSTEEAVGVVAIGS